MRDSFNTRPFRSSKTANFELVTSKTLMLHPGFVVCILNDVYGIQARAGCSCTGPYGHRLFKIKEENNELSDTLRKLTRQNYHAFKPGWARVNFNYFISDEELNFICDAITQIGKHGWKLLPFYEQELSSGLYIHRGEKIPKKGESSTAPMISLKHLTLSTKHVASKLRSSNPTQRTSNDFRRVLDNAEMIYGAAENQLQTFLKTRKNSNIEINRFTEPLPDFIEPDKIWWATSLDVIDYLEGLSDMAGPLICDRIEIPSPIVGIDDVNIGERRSMRRGSMLKTDTALLNSAQLLSRKPIQERRDSMTASFRLHDLDTDTLIGAVYMAETANLRNRG